MNGMKYLVFQYEDNGIETLYLFPETEKHADFAARMPKQWKAVRGGFFRLMDGTIVLYGEAFSLGLRGDQKKDHALFVKQALVD
jgi:hypothetical protein